MLQRLKVSEKHWGIPKRNFLLLFSKLLPETQEYLLIVAKELLNKQQKLIGNDRNSRYEPLKSI